MIRFVDLKDQIVGEVSEFAFYDTIKDRFLTFGDEQKWQSIALFKKAWELDGHDIENVDRFLNLIPKRWPNCTKEQSDNHLHLEWIYKRLLFHYDENPNVDYMIKFFEIIKNYPN